MISHPGDQRGSAPCNKTNKSGPRPCRRVLTRPSPSVGCFPCCEYCRGLPCLVGAQPGHSTARTDCQRRRERAERLGVVQRRVVEDRLGEEEVRLRSRPQCAIPFQPHAASSMRAIERRAALCRQRNERNGRLPVRARSSVCGASVGRGRSESASVRRQPQWAVRTRMVFGLVCVHSSEDSAAAVGMCTCW